MSQNPHTTDSLSWQVRQRVRQFQEWVEYLLRPDDADTPADPAGESWWNWLNWDWRDEFVYVVFWVLVTVLVIWLAKLLYQALRPSVQSWLEERQQWVTLGGKRSQTVPAEEHSGSHWWQQAQKLAQQGNYAEACKALYRGTLQQLHDSQQLRHDASRTDGEYLKTLAGESAPPRPYKLLIGTHERLTFGRAIASSETFQRCRRAYEEITRK